VQQFTGPQGLKNKMPQPPFRIIYEGEPRGLAIAGLILGILGSFWLLLFGFSMLVGLMAGAAA